MNRLYSDNGILYRLRTTRVVPQRPAEKYYRTKRKNVFNNRSTNEVKKNIYDLSERELRGVVPIPSFVCGGKKTIRFIDDRK